MLGILKKMFGGGEKPQSHMRYICDPDKHTECSKEFCGILQGDPEKCLCTAHRKYAMFPDKVSVYDEDRNLVRAMQEMSLRHSEYYTCSKGGR